MGKDGNLAYSQNPNRYIPSDVFGFTLSYFENDYLSAGSLSSTKQFEASTVDASLNSDAPNMFNGNIRHMAVAIKAFGNSPISYSYKYDQLNRIMEMNAYSNYDSTNHYWQNSGSALSAYHNTFS